MEKCIKVCPLNAIDEGSRERGKTLVSAPNAPDALMNVPKKAIMYYIHGTKFGVHPNAARLIYLYSALDIDGSSSRQHYQHKFVYHI